MQQYKEILQEILDTGYEHVDRTGVGRISRPGIMKRFDLKKGFPAITIRKLFFKSMVVETLWFISGSESIDFLHEHNVRIWDSWAHPKRRTVGPMYGTQLRHWEGVRTDDNGYLHDEVDQLQTLINNLKERPFSSRHCITLWNPVTVPKENESFQDNVEEGRGALANCHGSFIQCFVRELSDEEKAKYGKQYGLSLHMHQRSSDTPVAGTSWNPAQYALLCHMIAQVTDMVADEFILSIGDAHIYTNQVEGVREMLTREPLPQPTLWINPDIKNIDDFKPEDFELRDYQHHPDIRFPVAI